MAATEENLRKEAVRNVRKRRELGAHIVAYIVVNAALVGIWALGDRGYFWPAWIMLGWGIGLVLNIWDVYFRRPVTEHDIQREMDRLRR